MSKWCQMNRRIEDIGTEEPVLVGGLLWMGGDSLLLPGWNLLGMGSLAKRSWMCG